MPSAQKLAVIGDPIAHSLSPVLQNFLIRHFALPFTYEALHIRPNELAEMMQRLHRGEFRGINVTLPHKQSVLAFLNEINATAARIGAANTVVVEEGKLNGYNTDALGFSHSLETTGIAIANRKAFVLGAGGARGDFCVVAGEYRINHRMQSQHGARGNTHRRICQSRRAEPNTKCAVAGARRAVEKK